MANFTVYNLTTEIEQYIDLRIAQSDAAWTQLLQTTSETSHNLLDDNARDLNISWVIICAVLVFFMQTGFTMLEAGYVHPKNVTNIIFMHMIETCISAGCFWLVGWGLAYSAGSNVFLGTEFFTATDIHNRAGAGGSDRWEIWFMEWALAGSAGTIVAGSVAERAKPEAFGIFQLVMTGFLYPVVAYWIWGSGWLSSWGSNGFVDFAGSGAVNAVGGFAGLMGSIVAGARTGRFREDGSVVVLHEGNKVLQSAGVFILWFSWYGFTCGATMQLSGGMANVAGKVAMTTTMSAASACLTTTLLAKVVEGHFDVSLGLCGVMAGLVSITANCAVVDPWMALAIGVVGGLVFYGSHCLLLRCRIDDPCEGVAIHGFCGIWGMWGTGVFCKDDNLMYARFPGVDNACAEGLQLGIQVAGSLAVIGWTCVIAGAAFLAIASTIGLRVSADDEEKGLDTVYHGLAEYPKDDGHRPRGSERVGSAVAGEDFGAVPSPSSRTSTKKKGGNPDGTTATAAPEGKVLLQGWVGAGSGAVDMRGHSPTSPTTPLVRAANARTLSAAPSLPASLREGRIPVLPPDSRGRAAMAEQRQLEAVSGSEGPTLEGSELRELPLQEDVQAAGDKASGQGHRRSRSRERGAAGSRASSGEMGGGRRSATRSRLRSSASAEEEVQTRGSTDSDEPRREYLHKKSTDGIPKEPDDGVIGKVGGMKGIPFSYKVRRHHVSEEGSRSSEGKSKGRGSGSDKTIREI